MTEEELEKNVKIKSHVVKCLVTVVNMHLTEEERQQFEAEGRRPSIRFRVPQDQTYTFNDMVKGEISFDSNNIGDWVIVKRWHPYL